MERTRSKVTVGSHGRPFRIRETTKQTIIDIKASCLWDDINMHCQLPGVTNINVFSLWTGTPNLVELGVTNLD